MADERNGDGAKSAREARLAEALRANLRRRKAQARGRADPPAGDARAPAETKTAPGTRDSEPEK